MFVMLTCCLDPIASKVFHDDHGYDQALKAVDESLQRFGFGE